MVLCDGRGYINMEAVSGEIYLGEANTDSSGTLDEPVTVTIVRTFVDFFQTVLFYCYFFLLSEKRFESCIQEVLVCCGTGQEQGSTP